MKFIAETFIKAIVVLPGYTNRASTWPNWQTNVAIYASTAGGTQQLCGILSEYYSTYSETVCNIRANEIIAVQQNKANNLVFCVFGVFTDVEPAPAVPTVPVVNCDCALS